MYRSSLLLRTLNLSKSSGIHYCNLPAHEYHTFMLQIFLHHLHTKFYVNSSSKMVSLCIDKLYDLYETEWCEWLRETTSLKILNQVSIILFTIKVRNYLLDGNRENFKFVTLIYEVYCVME